jgi:hypothetical protein
VSYNLLLGLLWTVTGMIYVYRAVYRGGLITLSHQPPTRSKRNQWMHAVLGLFYLAFGFIYLVSAYLRHIRHLD